MRIISHRALRLFAADHPRADPPLNAWRRIVEQNRFENWASLKATFNTVDKVGNLTVFNISGNKYRVIAHIKFETQTMYIRAVLTHREYDKGAWKA